MRFSNNTTYKHLTNQELLNDVAHLLLNVKSEEIEHIELTNTKVTVMGVDTLLLETSVTKNLKIKGTISWFDESSGFGTIRLASGRTIGFFSCNVLGANSSYPERVTNVQFQDGAKVSFEIPADVYTYRALGAVKVKAV